QGRAPQVQRGGEGRAGQARRRSPWAVRREFRSTYRADPAPAEKVVAGKWWAPSDTTPQVSIEKEVASELGVGLGDTITWNVQGVQIPARVTSLRDVTWARFAPNFFVVFNPGSLEHAPKQFAILASVPTSMEGAVLQRAVVLRYPNVSSLGLPLRSDMTNQ